MKITVKQLKQLIREQVEEMQGRPDPRIHLNSPDWLTATSGQKAAHIFQRISDIWKEEAGMIETEDSEISRNWRRRAADIAELSPREIVVALEEQRKKATEFSDYMKNF